MVLVYFCNVLFDVFVGTTATAYVVVDVREREFIEVFIRKCFEEFCG